VTTLITAAKETNAVEDKQNLQDAEVDTQARYSS